MRRAPVATMIALLLAIVLLNVWREGGTPAVKSWVKAKFLNKPDPRPRQLRAA